MSFRNRLLLALTVVALVPVIVLAVGVRHRMGERLTAEYERRVDSLVAVIEDDLAQEGLAVAERLRSLAASLAGDNRFRLAAVAAVEAERRYLLDYGGRAMRLAGLDMLQIQDEDGRILTSGHFRNEYGRLAPGLPEALAGGGAALTWARTAETRVLVLARAEPFRLAGRRFWLVGGRAMEGRLLSRLARGTEGAVSLIHPGGVLSSDPQLRTLLTEVPAAGAMRLPGQMVRDLPVPFVEADGAGGVRKAAAHFLVSHPLDPLVALRRRLDIWFLVVAAVTTAGSLLLAGWLSSRVSRPLRELAQKTGLVDLDRPDVSFATQRRDEVGSLSRLMDQMVERLRTSVSRLREAERRATIGDLARQVNHDIKNGLIPVRNVFRHLAQLAAEEPEKLAQVFRERQGTLDSGIAYLETLASNYARLSPGLQRSVCDVNAAVSQVVRGLGQLEGVRVEMELAETLPPVTGDPVALRRIVENLVSNALESLGSRRGEIRVETELVADGGRGRIRLTVADTGSGMSPGEAARIFDDFYTTKEGGTGLGLSITRRLVQDLDGRLDLETERGRGSRFMVELPVPEVAAVAGTDRPRGDGV